MVFPSNQVKQFFVLKESVSTPADVLAGAAGAYCVNTNTEDPDLVSFTIKGEKGGITTTDIIDKKCLVKVTSKTADDLATLLKAVKVELNSNVNEGNPVVSLDYVLAIDFKQGAGYSDEDSYIKHAAVRATSAMTDGATGKKLFYEKLAASIVQNFKKVYSPLIEVATAATGGTVAVNTKVDDEKGTIPVDATGTEVEFTDGIYLRAVSQEDQWVRGTKELQFVNFDVHFSTIKVDGMDEVWGKKGDVTETYNKTVKNGYMAADMEWYFMGDRADMYRDVWGRGKSIDTKYMVDPSKEYDFFEIQYFYSGPGTEDTGKSPKHITFVGEKGFDFSEIDNALTV